MPCLSRQGELAAPQTFTAEEITRGLQEKIKEIFHKWKKHSEKQLQSGLTEERFDTEVCNEIQALIKNHKSIDKGQCGNTPYRMCTPGRQE